LFYRIIDDEIDESESEIALVVVKEGEKISLVRFLPSKIGHSSVHTMTIPPEPKNEPKFGMKTRESDRQRSQDNTATYQKMEKIRARLNARKKNLQNKQLPPLIQRLKNIKVF
jgi:hypothetical protein